MGIDWSLFKFPKAGARRSLPEPLKSDGKKGSKPALAKPAKGDKARQKAARLRLLLKLKAAMKALVVKRQGGRCLAEGICPECEGAIRDRHELIPVGRGGEYSPENCVGLCGRCHRLAQNAVGGPKLLLRWAGWPNGKPNAAVRGNVQVIWDPDLKLPGRHLSITKPTGLSGGDKGER